VIAHTFSDEGLGSAGRERAERDLDGIVRKLEKSEGLRPLRPMPAAVLPKAQPDAKAFEAAVGTLKRHIRAGDFCQAVLSRRETFALSAHPFSVYRELRGINPSPYHFYFNSGETTIVGASPEMLVRVHDGIAETCPIAGTRPRGKTEADDRAKEKSLLKSTKERAEHLMLVDLSRNDLGRVCKPGTVRVPEFFKVERFSHVMHLVSRVEGELKKSVSPLEALFSCFPAGTLTGAPKIRAMELVARLEPHCRGAYGGALVLHGLDGSLDSCITIRSLVASHGETYLQAGAGIVADSNAEREYQETEHKLAAMRAAIARAARATEALQ
jgi:anthranilate synthase component 1